MNASSTKSQLVFLLGAGFSIDAASEAGNPLDRATMQPVRYPLVFELLKICFEMNTFPPDKSIEDLFQDSIDTGNRKPIESLLEYIMAADYYITPHLVRGGSHENNAYRKFVRDFPYAPLLTFNYDSLPEILLLNERFWSPKDGYGIDVKAGVRRVRDKTNIVNISLRPVLHLHGTPCVYSATFDIERRSGAKLDMLQLKNDPAFLFDPDSLGDCFSPFTRINPGVTYTHISDRVIAPIPNKAVGLTDDFIKAVYSRAVKSIVAASHIVVIGYSFNQHDRASYAQLLAAAANKSILLVAPDADSYIDRLAREHRNILWKVEKRSFKEWVDKGYPGLK